MLGYNGAMKRRLLELLADGHLHSGAALAANLGVSRTAVWKGVTALRALGVEVQAEGGKGYRIPGGLELLDAERIRRLLPASAAALLAGLEVLEEVDSTNRYLADLAERAHARSVLAERQTRGRGRRGRSWVSPFGRNLYLSVGWRWEGGIAALEGLSPAVALAVRRALGGDPRLAVKWPNDVLLDGRKVAGILSEIHGDPVGPCLLVVGIGVNLGMGESGAAIDQPWADLTELGRQGRNATAAALLAELLPLLDRFPRSGFEPFREEWNRLDLCRDRPVRVHLAGNPVDGVARGVGPTGALLVETGGVLRSFQGGEISVRAR
ncbi:MAG: bifunctional ligase/repressor BirA [Porticoccaceae bacterium]|nr:MAG: bifunctional ligase/repressor BirA [Porticoccaceae bacterium]